MLAGLRSFVLDCCPYYRQVSSLTRWCDAGTAIHNWEAANKIPISWSEKGRELVRENIAAYLDFIKYHRWLKFDVDYVAMWSAHLKPAPFNPNPPRRRSPQPRGLSFCPPVGHLSKSTFPSITRVFNTAPSSNG